MIRRGFFALLLAAGLATGVAAQDAGVLVIEVDGQAKGTIEIALNPDAPQHAERLKELARAGAYDGVVFHRVIDGFMAQTGDVEFGTRAAFPEGRAGTGGSNLPDLPAEFSTPPSSAARWAWRGRRIRTRPTASSSSCSPTATS